MKYRDGQHKVVVLYGGISFNSRFLDAFSHSIRVYVRPSGRPFVLPFFRPSVTLSLRRVLGVSIMPSNRPCFMRSRYRCPGIAIIPDGMVEAVTDHFPAESCSTSSPTPDSVPPGVPAVVLHDKVEIYGAAADKKPDDKTIAV